MSRVVSRWTSTTKRAVNDLHCVSGWWVRNPAQNTFSHGCTLHGEYEVFQVAGVFFVARVLNLHQYARQQQGLKQETGGCNSNTLICVSNLGMRGTWKYVFKEGFGEGYRWVKSWRKWLPRLLGLGALTHPKRQTWQKLLHNTALAFVSFCFWLSECAWH